MKRNLWIYGFLLLLVGFLTTESQAQCTADFTTSTSGSTVTFNNNSTGPFVSSFWTFGDGNNSGLINPSHTYSTTGWYNVCLTVSDSASNCFDTYCDSVYVVATPAPCQADFTYTTSGNTVTLTNTSTGSYTITSWTFGDGNSSGLSSPSHTYSTSGWYNVCLTISDSSSNCNDTYCDSVYVQTGTSCQASFTLSVLGNTVNFTNTSSGPYTITSWTFGDGNSSGLSSPSHTYSSGGWYGVCLTVSDSGSNCNDTYCDSIYIQPSASCQASFTYTISGSTVNFTNTSSGPYTFTDWTFGDGGTSGSANPSHTYTGSGWYGVCLTVSDSGSNCFDTYCDSIYIQNTAPCQASFTYTITGNTVVFTNTSNIQAGNDWQFGDGNSTNGFNATHTYANAGSYWVCLTVTDSANCLDTYCDSIVIPPPAPCQASFTYTVSGNTVTFTNTSNIQAGDDWDFGDGNSSNMFSPIHTYNGPGSYLVCLTVTDSFTCIDTYCDTVVIPGNPVSCQADFSVTTNGLMANFADQSTSSTQIMVWDWSFGDGNSSSAANPSHTYSAAGTYNVCLTIADTMGCSDTVCHDVTVADSTTGLQSRIGSQAGWKLYPNPTQGQVTVEYEGVVATQVVVYNQVGQLVITQSLTSSGSRQVLDLAQQPAGFYIISLLGDSGEMLDAKRLVKK